MGTSAYTLKVSILHDGLVIILEMMCASAFMKHSVFLNKVYVANLILSNVSLLNVVKLAVDRLLPCSRECRPTFTLSYTVVNQYTRSSKLNGASNHSSHKSATWSVLFSFMKQRGWSRGGRILNHMCYLNLGRILISLPWIFLRPLTRRNANRIRYASSLVITDLNRATEDQSSLK